MDRERIVYLNGRFIPRSEAKLDIEDRGVLFADGVYEVVQYYGGKGLALDRHLARLHRSLEGIEIDLTDATRHMDRISDRVVEENGLSDARVYWQVTRGVAPREHAPPADLEPTVLAMASPAAPLEPSGARTLSAILADDRRWHLCSVKSLMLLPNVLAKARAKRAGAEEAILVRDGVVTEGASTNVFIVRDDELWTHPANELILGGITRDIVVELAERIGVPVRERTYFPVDLLTAQEAFLTGTTTHVAAVGRVEDTTIADGRPGRVTAALHRALMQYIAEACGLPTQTEV